MKVFNLVVLLFISNQGFSANIEPLADHLLESSLKKEFFFQVKKKSVKELGEAAWPEVYEKLDYHKNFEFIETTKKIFKDLALEEDEVDDIEFDQAWSLLSEFIKYYCKHKVRNILAAHVFHDVSILYSLSEMMEDLVHEINSVRNGADFAIKSKKLGTKLKQYLSDEYITNLTKKIPH